MTLTEKTVAIQKAVGTTPDGIVGPKTLSAVCTHIGATYSPNTKQAWENIQRKLNSKGAGLIVDGIYGNKTADALLAALNGTCSKAKTIIIDIGHANGTGSRGFGREEHASNVIVAQHLQQQLSAAGVNVVVLDFPEKDNTTDLNLTKSTANQIGADLLISLHHDASDSPSAKGAHVIYYRDSSRKYAEAVAKPLAELFPGRAEKVVQRSNLAILKVNFDAILCESGFITNEHDWSIQKNHPEQIAQSIVSGLKSSGLI